MQIHSFPFWVTVWKGKKNVRKWSISRLLNSTAPIPSVDALQDKITSPHSPPLLSAADKQRGPPGGEALSLHSLAGQQCSSVLCLHPSLHPTTHDASPPLIVHCGLGGKEGEGEEAREWRETYVHWPCKAMWPMNTNASYVIGSLYMYMYIRIYYIRSFLGTYRYYITSRSSFTVVTIDESLLAANVSAADCCLLQSMLARVITSYSDPTALPGYKSTFQPLCI